MVLCIQWTKLPNVFDGVIGLYFLLLSHTAIKDALHPFKRCVILKAPFGVSNDLLAAVSCTPKAKTEPFPNKIARLDNFTFWVEFLLLVFAVNILLSQTISLCANCRHCLQEAADKPLRLCGELSTQSFC